MQYQCKPSQQEYEQFLNPQTITREIFSRTTDTMQTYQVEWTESEVPRRCYILQAVRE